MERDTTGKEIKEAVWARRRGILLQNPCSMGKPPPRKAASKKKVKFLSHKLDVCYLEYTNGGTRIELRLPSGEPFAVATAWVPGLEEDEVAVKNYSENAGVLQALIDGEVVEPPHRAHGLNFCHLDVCRLV